MLSSAYPSTLIAAAGLAIVLAAPGAQAHDAPNSTTYDLLVPSDPMTGQITFVTLIGPAPGQEVLHTTWDLTFTSPPGGTLASDVLLQLTMPLVGGNLDWEINGADLGWPAATGTFSGTLGSDMLNGVLAEGLLPGTSLPHLNIGAETGGLTGQFTNSTIHLELAGETCQEDLGFQGPGNAAMSICGEPLSSTSTATFSLTGAPPSTLVFLAAGVEFGPTPFAGGTFVPLPFLDLFIIGTDAQGEVSFPVTGGLGPVTVYLQGIVIDGAQPFGYGLTNALAVELLP